MKNKIIANLRLNESVMNETEVAHDGDFVVIIKNNGEEERFKPVGLTAAEVVEKFFAIKKHSEGRAWQWLRKVQREEEREAEIEDESTVEEAPADPINEEEDSTTECPYHNLLADLLNKENVTVQDYEAAIIKFNEAPDIPEEKKVRIIEILNHIKDEELEHVNELQLADKILKGEEEEAPVEGEQAPEAEAETEEPEEVSVTVEEPVIEEPEEETFESIKEAINPDSDIFKLLKGKEFENFEAVEELFGKEGFEVVEVFKEGDGFNVNLRKDGEEFFIPFCACAGKFCAVLEAAPGEVLEEGLGDWIAAKVAKVVGKGNGINAKKKMVDDLQKTLGDAVKVVSTDKGINILPAQDFVVSIDTNIDSDGLHLGELKAVSLNPKELADAVKKVIGIVDAETPAEEKPVEGETPAEDNAEVEKYIEGLKSAGIDEVDDLKKYVAKKFPDYKGEVK